MKTEEKQDAGARLFARVLRDVLSTGRFESTGDLKEAVWKRCRHLRIRYDVAAVDRALDLVGTNHPLVFRLPQPSSPERRPEVSAISHLDAISLLTGMKIRVRGMR